jgi:hypothetical protein
MDEPADGPADELVDDTGACSDDSDGEVAGEELDAGPAGLGGVVVH